MKNFLLILAALISSHVFAQVTIGSVPIEEIDAEYLEIVGQAKMLKLMEVNIYVDYGQVGGIKDIKEGHIKDASGKRIAFNGMMGAVNFFVDYGYELDFAYPLSTGNGMVYHYILKKDR